MINVTKYPFLELVRIALISFSIFIVTFIIIELIISKVLIDTETEICNTLNIKSNKFEIGDINDYINFLNLRML